MTRTASPARSTKRPKTKATSPQIKPPKSKTTKTKDGWEMSARDALQVNFVVSEI